MRGMPFACIAQSAIHPLPISATAKSGWTIANHGLPILEMATLSHDATMRLMGRVRAVRSAVTLQLQHLRHLRWQVSCATRVRRRPIVSVRSGALRIAGLLVSMRWAITRGIACTAGINALGHWYQCQGQAGPALTERLRKSIKKMLCFDCVKG